MMSDTLTLQITDLARSGAGVARDPDGRVIFVPKTAPGDQVTARIRFQDKRYAEAELIEILTPSPQRITPPCPVFDRCGGCEWQHLDYAYQWKIKSQGVRHALERVEIDPTTVPHWDELPAEQIWNYRNRIQLRGEGNQIGFFAPRSHTLIPIEECKIARPEINEQISRLREEGSQKPREYKVEIEVLPNHKTRATWNSRHGAAGFRQIHDEQNAKLQKWIATHIQPADILYDLYGGSGNLSLALASCFQQVHCVDVGSPAIRPEGTPDNLRFHRAPILPWLMHHLNTQKKPGTPTVSSATAILDPPREGLGTPGDFQKIEKDLRALHVTQVIAVGCDPDSWARDLSRWLKKSWQLQRIAVLDFFPQTHHVEAAAVLTRIS